MGFLILPLECLSTLPCASVFPLTYAGCKVLYVLLLPPIPPALFTPESAACFVMPRLDSYLLHRVFNVGCALISCNGLTHRGSQSLGVSVLLHTTQHLVLLSAARFSSHLLAVPPFAFTCSIAHSLRRWALYSPPHPTVFLLFYLCPHCLALGLASVNLPPSPSSIHFLLLHVHYFLLGSFHSLFRFGFSLLFHYVPVPLFSGRRVDLDVPAPFFSSPSFMCSFHMLFSPSTMDHARCHSWLFSTFHPGFWLLHYGYAALHSVCFSASRVIPYTGTTDSFGSRSFARFVEFVGRAHFVSCPFRSQPLLITYYLLFLILCTTSRCKSW